MRACFFSGTLISTFVYGHFSGAALPQSILTRALTWLDGCFHLSMLVVTAANVLAAADGCYATWQIHGHTPKRSDLCSASFG